MIYVIFRLAKNYSCELSSLITLNYFTATILGLFLFNPLNTSIEGNAHRWIPFGILLGLMFITMFYLIGNSSQKAGVTITTLANKLSLVLPLSIFVGSGITDSVVKYVQTVKIDSSESSIFSSLVFFVAYVCGGIISITKKSRFKLNHYPTLLLGVLLGVTNFGSLYFIINALNKSNLNRSLVFTINNMSIVALSPILGTFFFQEKLNKINISGILLAIISLYFLL